MSTVLSNVYPLCTPCIRFIGINEYPLQHFTIMQGAPPAQTSNSCRVSRTLIQEGKDLAVWPSDTKRQVPVPLRHYFFCLSVVLASAVARVNCPWCPCCSCSCNSARKVRAGVLHISLPLPTRQPDKSVSRSPVSVQLCFSRVSVIMELLVCHDGRAVTVLQ